MKKTYTTLARGIVVDDARTREILPFIERAWLTGAKGFASFERVESRMRPPTLSTKVTDSESERLKAVFLFLQGYSQRSGKPAISILRKLLKWWEERPELLDPRNALENTPDFSAFVREVDPQARAETQFREVAWWQRVMRVLREEYNSDPRQLFYHLKLSGEQPFLDQVMQADMDSWEDVSALRERLIKDLTDFQGVRLKVTSMILIFFQEAEWHENEAFWERLRRIPFVPFDLHHIRLSWMLEIVPLDAEMPERARQAHRDYVGEILSNYISKLCYELGLSHSAVAQSIFNTGAFIHAAWNRSKADTHAQALICLHRCPFNQICRKVVRPDKQLQTKKKGRSKNTRALRRLDQLEAHARGELPAGTLVQPVLDSSMLPSRDQLLAERAQIGAETHDRGAICRDIDKRPPPLYSETLFGHPDDPLEAP